jgi:very-short-patch-repair endonuclease
VVGYELDMFWPEERFAVELDTFATHGAPGSFEADRLRQEDLLLVGVGMTRVTDRRLAREPRQVIARIAGLLEKRRREAAAS